MSAGRWWWWEHRRTRAEQTQERRAALGIRHPHGAADSRAQSRGHTCSLQIWASLRPLTRCVRLWVRASVSVVYLRVCVCLCTCMCTCVCVCLLVFPSPPHWGGEAIPLHRHPDTLLSTHAHTRKFVHPSTNTLTPQYILPTSRHPACLFHPDFLVSMIPKQANRFRHSLGKECASLL